MKYRLLLSSCALALFVPSLALGGEPSLASWVQRRVGDGLVKPLAKHEESGSRFSRSRPPPRERRVRALQTTASVDKRDRPFVPFAVDVRFGSGEWRDGDILGCVYRSSGDIFVKVGEEYRPAAFLLGKDLGPVAGACEASPSAPPRA
ncbi:MAG TPA: hypothetical protein VFZ53_25470 [Polyangiaceae bacterium]